MKILFVCLGNICRSPLAQGAFIRHAKEKKYAVDVDSAGTGDWHIGHAPDTRAQQTALRYGFDIADQRARQVQETDFYRFTHVVAMDSDNIKALLEVAPKDMSCKITRLLDWDTSCSTQDVPDPYTGDMQMFDRSFSLIDKGTLSLIHSLQTSKQHS